MFLFKKRKNNKVVIFIHGLDNKPTKKLLKKWYLKAIEEGFSKHGYNLPHFDFKVVYWADLLYTRPLDPLIDDKQHGLYLDEPYHPSTLSGPNRESPTFKRKLLDRLEKFTDGLFLSKNSLINVEYIFDWVTSRTFRDLHVYYRKGISVNKKPEESAKKIIRERLKNVLTIHQKREILLIAHSMGSIVAYDVLTFMVPEINIHSLVTLGSPLGLPMIKREIFKEFELDYTIQTQLPTPENIQKAWHNLADPDDNVALNYKLLDDYSANSAGVAPKDILVKNDYEYEGRKNPHKSFGYLRTYETVVILHDFLQERKPRFFENIAKFRRSLFYGSSKA